MNNKYKYKNFSGKKPNTSRLDVNLKGFLCSCNNREKDCIKEAYNILNKYADKLYPSAPETLEKIEESVEDELKNELAALRSNSKDAKRFQVVESGAKNLLFIKTTLKDPVALAEAIVSDINETKSSQTRFLIRLVPIEVTCRAYLNDIESAFAVLAEKYFKDSPRTFSVVYNHRNNNNLNRDDVIKTVANIALNLNTSNKVDLKSPNVSIIVEVIKGIVLLGIVPKYFYYKKYNLLAISDQLEHEGSGSVSTSVADKEELDPKNDESAEKMITNLKDHQIVDEKST